MTPETDTTNVSEQPDVDGLVITTSDAGFDATLDRIKDDIENGPLTLLATVDHAANAESVDKELPPTTLLIFGNPEVGTPLMQAVRTVAIDLPQKLLIWEANGTVNVAYNDPQYLADRHGIDGQQDRLQKIGSVLDQLATGTN